MVVILNCILVYQIITECLKIFSPCIILKYIAAMDSMISYLFNTLVDFMNQLGRLYLDTCAFIERFNVARQESKIFEFVSKELSLRIDDRKRAKNGNIYLKRWSLFFLSKFEDTHHKFIYYSLPASTF